MRKILSYSNHILYTILLASIFSCADVEKSDIKPNDDIVVETPSTSDSPEETPPEETPEITECILGLSNVEEGETISINCLLDLEEKTIMLPKNVTLSYDGGDIINGTLNFSNTGQIDGRLLNSSLKIDGDAQLINTEFEFTPSRWGIIEGKVNDDVARRNRDILEESMFLIKELGGQKFSIDKMDAYFKVDEPSGKPVPSLAAINVPSDYHLLMSDNTHLRMQPNAYKRPDLIGLHRITNTIIEGGFLHGDRDEHDYSSGGTHEWGHTITILGSTNITIQGVTSMDATGDGMTISSFGHAFDPHYTPCDNILITDCKIIRSRRNGIGSGDGRNVLIEKNEFIDVGQDTDKSTGTPPRMAIDIEAHNRDGKIFQIAKDFTIRNNKERGSVVMSFYIASGYNIVIEDNITESPISYFGTHNSIIRNNEITAATDRQRNNVIGIWAGASITEFTNYNNKIYNNTVNGYAVGIDILNFDNEVYNNTIKNCRTGIVLNTLKDSKIYNNTIISNRERSAGIASKPHTETINNVIVEDNNIEVVLQAFNFVEVNDKDGDTNTFEIKNNKAKAEKTSSFNFLSGITFSKNELGGGMRLVGAKNSEFSNNTITTTGDIHGIDFSSLNDNIKAIDNTIAIKKGRAQCIRDKENNNNLTIENNNCSQL